MKPVKNLVAPTGECHQVNPLTGFVSGMAGSAEKARVMSNAAQSRNVTAQAAPLSANQVQAAPSVPSDFYSVSHGPVAGPVSGWSEPLVSSWGDEFQHRPGPVMGPMVGPMVGPMMGPMMSMRPMMGPQSYGSSVYTPPSQTSDLAAAKRMVDLMRNSGNPKFANSNFVEFIDQVASGNLSFKEGEVVDKEGAVVDWDGLYSEGNDVAYAGDDAEGLPDQMERIWNEMRGENGPLSQTSVSEYNFQHASNPYIESDENLLLLANRLISEGRDSEAIVVLEAEVRVNPNSSEGWRLLGQLHAQLDCDTEAIACLEKGHACDAFNLDSMLSLGVSLTNELDSVRALNILGKWIETHPQFHSLSATTTNTNDSFDYDFSKLRKRVLQQFLRARELDPTNAKVAASLGVIYNISREYAPAIESLLVACELDGSDFSLWNKLGATMANSGLSQQSLIAYHQALALKPNYARAWSNLAIAHTNLSDYESASKFFLTALQISPNAKHLWSSLFLALSNFAPERNELSDLIDNRDIQGLIAAIQGTPVVSQLPKPRSADSQSAVARIRQSLVAP